MTAWRTVGRTGPTEGRRFNHDEARRRYLAGETRSELRRALGISSTTLEYAIRECDTRRSMRRWWLARYSRDEIRDLGGGLL